MRRLTHLVILAAFVFSLGGHWYVLQGLAWVNMVREYSQVVPFTTAIGMTFSGHYPCAICQAIAEKKNSEQEKTFTFDKYDKKFCPPARIEALAFPAAVSISYVVSQAVLRFRSETPPVPPPRSALV
jgi:hypothetical protein